MKYLGITLDHKFRFKNTSITLRKDAQNLSTAYLKWSKYLAVLSMKL
jgi:hypothetical protein